MAITPDTCTGKLSGSHHKLREGGVMTMKGYVTATGYMGYVNGYYVLFSDESDYRDYYMEHANAA